MRSPASPAPEAERGSAVVEFVLVSVLLVALFLAVVQVGVALHVRNTLTAAAAEGARHGGNADRSPSQGAARTRQLITESLSSAYARDVRARTTTVGGAQVVEIEVRSTLPVFGLAGPDRRLVVRSRAFEESQ